MKSGHPVQNLPAIKILFNRELNRNDIVNVKKMCQENGSELKKQVEFKDSVQQAISLGYASLANILIENDFPISTECKPSLLTLTLEKKFTEDMNDDEKIKILKELAKKISPTLADLKIARSLGDKFINVLILHSNYNLEMHNSLIELFSHNLLTLIEYCIKNDVLEHLIKCMNSHSKYNLIPRAIQLFADGINPEEMLLITKTLLQHGTVLSAKALNAALECKENNRMMDVLVANFQSIPMLFQNGTSDVLSEHAAKMVWKYPKLTLYFIKQNTPVDILRIQVSNSSYIDSRNIYPIKLIFEFYQQKSFSQDDMLAILHAIKKNQPHLLKKEETLDLAIQTGDEKLVSLLINSGAKPTPLFNLGDNALDKAVKNDHIQIVKMLLALNTVDWDFNHLTHAHKLCTKPEQDRTRNYLFCVMSVAKNKSLEGSLFEKIHHDDRQDLITLLKIKYTTAYASLSKNDVRLAASKKPIHSEIVTESKQHDSPPSPTKLGLFQQSAQQTSDSFPDRDSWLKTLKKCVEEGKTFLKDQETLPGLIESMLQEMNSNKAQNGTPNAVV